MTSLGAYHVGAVLILGLIVVAGFALTRFRGRLQQAFAPTPRRVLASVDLAPGARVALVDLDGVKVVCAFNRSGVTAMAIAPGDRP